MVQLKKSDLEAFRVTKSPGPAANAIRAALLLVIKLMANLDP
jgi:hypothetical protein